MSISVPATIPPMPTSAPRLIRSPSSDASEPVNRYGVRWLAYFPTLFARGPEFETTAELTIEAATAVLSRVLDAETTPHDRYEMRVYLRPRSDGTTGFRIIFVRVGTATTWKTTAELGIDDAVAREYMACDYIRHRYVNSSLMMPMDQMPANTDVLLNAAVQRMEQLHLELLSFVVK